VAAVTIVASLPSASAGSERGTTAHILVGVTPTAGFAVAVDGEETEGSPFASDAGGVLAFTLGDGYPAGPLTVSVGAPGALIIGSVGAGSVTETQALISWGTNVPATSQVEYGLTASYGESTPVDTVRVIDHAVVLGGLVSGTTYHYRVLSDDGQGQSAQSGDRTFATDSEPLVITGVHISDIQSDAATISWTTNRAANTRVDYGTTAAYGSSTALDPTLVMQHVVRIEGLESSTTYHFEAVSEDAHDLTARSGDLVFQTDPVPLALEGVEVIGVGPSTATVRWTTNRAASSRVDYGLTSTYGESAPVDSTLVTNHVIVLDGLAPGTAYRFRAVSEGPYGQVVESGDAGFETSMPPLAIGGVEVVDVGYERAVIRWLTDRPATSLVEYGLTDQYGSGQGPDPALTIEHSTTLSGLAEGTLYHFRVASTDAFDVDAASGDSTFTTLQAEPAGPPIVYGIGVVETSPTAVTLTWVTDRPATSLVRYGRDTAADSETPCDTTHVLDHAVSVSPLSPHVAYSFVVVSACGSDTTEGSPIEYATAEPPEVDPAAKSPEIGDVSVVITDPGSATVRWSTDRPCSTWIDYGPTEAYGLTLPGGCIGPCAYEARLSELMPETTYCYRLTAFAVGETLLAAVDSTFTTPPEVDTKPPLSPQAVEASDLAYAIELSWLRNGESDLLGYHVYRLVGGREGVYGDDRPERLTEDPLSDPYFLDDEVLPGLLYLYSVSAVDQCGNESELSDFIEARFDPPEVTLQLAIYPNPVVDSAKLSYSVPADGGDVVLRILTPTGRVVQEISGGTASRGEQTVYWNGRDRVGRVVGSGVYLCELAHGGGVTRRKLTLLK